MKQLSIVFTLTVFAMIFWFHDCQTVDREQTVSPLLGDTSFEKKFGHPPTASDDENIRIQTHLEYVEHVLRKKEVTELTETQKENRNHLLNLLHSYWTAGIFPVNYVFPDTRVPCFIDKEGRICAVGYLIAKTSGREVAEQINQKWKYSELLAMNDRTIDGWISESGLSKEECAMIQPAYAPPPSYHHISPSYGIFSAVLGGVNLSLNTINGIQISKGTERRGIAIISILTGALSIVQGVINFPPEGYTGRYYGTNESEKALSMINIGLGTSTMILGSWNLNTNWARKNKSISWKIYGVPTNDHQMGLGLALRKKI